MLHNKTIVSNFDSVIYFDETTGLPLLQEQEKILNLVQVTLTLPYTIAEYGCGNKCSIILRKLIELGIPPYALKRGMIMEKDMSDEALRETNFRKRQHALVIENPLYHPKDFYQETLFRMVEDKCRGVTIKAGELKAGDYLLHHDKELQFIQARSHIFSIVTFWDDEANYFQELVLDPTIDPKNMFEIEELRDYLNDDEALIFSAPMLGSLRLDPNYLTFLHARQLANTSWNTRTVLSDTQHAQLVRHLNKASPGSIGDPGNWTYANNIPNQDREVQQRQEELTGNGDILKAAFDAMMTARVSQLGSVVLLQEELQKLVEQLQIADEIIIDAKQAETQLASLAEVEMIIAYFRAVRQLNRWLQKGMLFDPFLQKQRQLNKVVGISMRLRRRIEKLAQLSHDEDQAIDARALNERFFAATLETIQQMNTAGMAVFIDKVGNIHGLYLPNPPDYHQLRDPAFLKKVTQNAICHCSHIDTVKDAGKYDGRLGVLAGIEIVHIIEDLKKYFNYIHPGMHDHRSIMVTAFIGEEMTFTGEGVSMPGSAAVVDMASPDRIYKMKNAEGELFGDRLQAMLTFLKAQQKKGVIHLVNPMVEINDPRNLQQACFEPKLFFTPNTYERHIEQGPVLDRHEVPLVLVDTIMGIHQEDFQITGEKAEQGAIFFNLHLRKRLKVAEFKNLRVTVGVIEGNRDQRQSQELDFAVRVRLEGERNHAGATLMEDRKDPGVATGRLAEKFLEMINTLNENRDENLQVLIGDIVLFPGTDRNVIPGNAEITLGVMGSISDPEQELLMRQLQAWIIRDLTNNVAQGGEGIILESIAPINFINYFKQTRVSIDLRGADEATMIQFLEEAKATLNHISQNLVLETSSTIEQQLPPLPLKASGQVLQIERSYGGSHNPNEAQLGNDLLIGSLLQLEVTLRFLKTNSGIDAHLYQMVKEHIPKAWRRRLDYFVSGALHDTCNIVAKNYFDNVNINK